MFYLLGERVAPKRAIKGQGSHSNDYCFNDIKLRAENQGPDRGTQNRPFYRGYYIFGWACKFRLGAIICCAAGKNARYRYGERFCHAEERRSGEGAVRSIKKRQRVPLAVLLRGAADQRRK